MNRRKFFGAAAAAATAAVVPKVGNDGFIVEEITQFSWHHHPDIMVGSESFMAAFDDIVTETFRRNAPRIAESIMAEHELVARLMDRRQSDDAAV